MTWDEVESKIADLLKDPDTMQAKAVELTDALKEDYAVADSTKTAAEKQAEQIKKLKETNDILTQHIIRHTPTDEQPEEEEPDEVETPEDADAFLASLADRRATDANS